MEKQYFAKYLPKPDGFRRVVKNEQGIPIDYKQGIFKIKGPCGHFH